MKRVPLFYSFILCASAWVFALSFCFSQDIYNLEVDSQNLNRYKWANGSYADGFGSPMVTVTRDFYSKMKVNVNAHTGSFTITTSVLDVSEAVYWISWTPPGWFSSSTIGQHEVDTLGVVFYDDNHNGDVKQASGAVEVSMVLREGNSGSGTILDTVTLWVGITGTHQITSSGSISPYLAAASNPVVQLYGNQGSAPFPRPGAEGPDEVDVTLDWDIVNLAGEDAIIYVETIDDAPILSIAPIAAGETSDYGTISVPVGAQIRIDSVDTVDGDPNVNLNYIGGTSTYTVPEGGGTWSGSWSIVPEGALEEYHVKVNVSNSPGPGGTFFVKYAGVDVGAFAIPSITAGQQQLEYSLSLLLASPLPLTFEASSGLGVTLLNGPSALQTGAVVNGVAPNVYDVAIHPSDETFTVSDSVTTSVTDEDGNTIHQGGTYERTLGNGESIYWTTGGDGYSPGTPLAPSTVTQGSSGNLPNQASGASSGPTAEEQAASDGAIAALNGFSDEIDDIKDFMVGADGFGKFDGLTDNLLANPGTRTEWVIAIDAPWLGFEIPTYTVHLDQQPFPAVRAIMLLMFSLGALFMLLKYLKV